MAAPVLAPGEHRDLSPAIERALRLFAMPLQSGGVDVARGYLDLLGRRDPTGMHPGQRLMASRTLQVEGGLIDVEQRVSGLAQFVSGRKPGMV
jgi:hypothetical protein